MDAGRLGARRCLLRKRDRALRLFTSTLLSAALGLQVGCTDEDDRRDDPAPDAVARVRDAAQRTLGAGPADLRLRVSSRSAAYSARGAIELATDRSFVRVAVARAPRTHYDRVMDVLALQGETYLVRGASPPAIQNGKLVGVAVPDILRALRSICALDPHGPVGNLGGAASVQEALALAGVAVRLLRDGTTKATPMRERAGGGATYRVEVDPGQARVAPSAEGSDETIVVAPRRLARQMAPLAVELGADGLVRSLALELRDFRPVVFAPGVRRQRRGERVAVQIALGDFGRAFSVETPRCIAME
jgi:hypothetical protein